MNYNLTAAVIAPRAIGHAATRTVPHRSAARVISSVGGRRNMGKRGNAVGEDGMPDLEVKSVNLLGTPVSYAYAVKAGPWIFLTGHEAFDFAGGIPEEVAGPAGFPLFGRPRSRREGDFILGRMRRILQEFGADLSNGVRLDQFFPNPGAVAAHHL